VTFQGIQIDTKLAAIQKPQVLGIISEENWWSDMEFLAHRLKSGRIERTTITVRVLLNEPLRLCFMGMDSSLDPNVTCDVQMSKKALPETCSVLESRGADALCRESMKAWHHLWHSLGATDNQIQCLILLNAEICMREEAEAIEVWSPSFPRSLKTVWQGHNEQSIGQIRLRYPKPIAEILSNTHRKPWTQALMWTTHGHDSFENSKGENAKCCPPLPQALSIKGDVTLCISHSRLLGRKWRCVGVEWPSAGKSVTNPALQSALPTKVNFMQEEWAAFGIAHLHFDSYIMSKSNDVVHYFQPAASKFDRWACESESEEEYKQTTLWTFKRPHSGCQKGGSALDRRHSRNLANWNRRARSVSV